MTALLSLLKMLASTRDEDDIGWQKPAIEENCSFAFVAQHFSVSFFQRKYFFDVKENVFLNS